VVAASARKLQASLAGEAHFAMASKRLPLGGRATRLRVQWIAAGGVIQGPVPWMFMRERSGGVFEAPLDMLGAGCMSKSSTSRR
jgi:hypothetical protein